MLGPEYLVEQFMPRTRERLRWWRPLVAAVETVNEAARDQRPASIESSAVTTAPCARLQPPEITSSSPSART